MVVSVRDTYRCASSTSGTFTCSSNEMGCTRLYMKAGTSKALKYNPVHAIHVMLSADHKHGIHGIRNPLEGNMQASADIFTIFTKATVISLIWKQGSPLHQYYIADLVQNILPENMHYLELFSK